MQNLVLFVLIVSLAFAGWCHGQGASELYSNLLLEGVREAGEAKGGFLLINSPDAELLGAPGFKPVDGLNTPDAIPFLIHVLKNGPGWTDEKVLILKGGMYPHIGRCYAALCLGAIGDQRALEPLIEAIQTPGEPNVRHSRWRRQYALSRYAAIALGWLRDPNAVEPLIEALQDGNINSIYALGRIGDFRAIRPMVEQVSSQKEPPFQDIDRAGRAVHDSLRYMTTTYFKIEHSHKDGTYTVEEFPELGTMDRTVVYRKLWLHWLKNGEKWTKETFEKHYRKYSEIKQARPEAKSAISVQRQKIYKLGVAAIPFMIEKIKKGDTDLIPLISSLTRHELKRTSTQAECLEWWLKNKHKWLIPFPKRYDLTTWVILVTIVAGICAVSLILLKRKKPSTSGQ